jgi:predicted transcriptional regulator of viral defense system
VTALAAPLAATFTTKAALEAGIHPRDLYGWRDAGSIIELSRGVYRRADAPPASYPDLLAIGVRVPRAIICCLSAAAIYELTDEVPATVQIAIPNRARPPRIDHPPTTALRFEETTFELGLSRVEAAPGEWVRIYDPARTVVDLMRLRHRFGKSAAHSALHRYLSRRDGRPALLLEYAQVLNVYGPVRSAVDIVSAR